MMQIGAGLTVRWTLVQPPRMHTVDVRRGDANRTLLAYAETSGGEISWLRSADMTKEEVAALKGAEAVLGKVI